MLDASIIQSHSSPERAKAISVGQSPTLKANKVIQALKGRKQVTSAIYISLLHHP